MSFFCYPITNFTCIRINSAREVACDQKWKIDYSTCRFKSTQEELVKKERLAAIDKILVTLNHEINNSLASIIIFSDILLMSIHILLPEKISDSIKMIMKESKKI